MQSSVFFFIFILVIIYNIKRIVLIAMYVVHQRQNINFIIFFPNYGDSRSHIFIYWAYSCQRILENNMMMKKKSKSNYFAVLYFFFINWRHRMNISCNLHVKKQTYHLHAIG